MMVLFVFIQYDANFLIYVKFTAIIHYNSVADIVK